MKRTDHLLAGSLGLLSLLLFAYATVRASTVSFSYDECYTFLEHVRKNRMYQDAFDQMGANHHLLNVWMMWGSWKLFGDSELALRVPSLLAYAIYLYATVRIALRSKSVLLGIGAFLLLNVHPYLIDFFSLARGYALGHAFIMLSLWQAQVYLLDGERRTVLVRAMAFALFAAMAHIVMLNYLLAFSGAWVGFLILVRRRDASLPRAEFLVLSAAVVGALLITLPNALGLFHGGSLYFGCDHIWTCTMRSLAEKLLYHIPYGTAPLVLLEKALWWGVGAWSFSVLVVWLSGTLRTISASLFAMLVLCLCLSAFLLQQVLFNVPLPQTRTALFLVPIGAFVVVTGLQSWPRWSGLAGLVSCLACVPLGILFLDAFNTRYAVEWKSTGELRTALERIELDHVRRGPLRPSVVVRTCFESAGCMSYYNHSRGWHWMAHSTRSDTLFQPADYYIVEYDSHHLVDTLNWKLLFHSEATNMTLYRDERMHRELSTVVHSEERGATQGSERSPVLRWSVPLDTVTGPVLISGSIQALERGGGNWIGNVITVWRNGRVLATESRPSHEQVGAYDTWTGSDVLLLVPQGLLKGDSVVYSPGPCFLEPPIDLGEAVLRVLH